MGSGSTDAGDGLTDQEIRKIVEGNDERDADVLSEEDVIERALAIEIGQDRPAVERIDDYLAYQSARKTVLAGLGGGAALGAVDFITGQPIAPEKYDLFFNVLDGATHMPEEIYMGLLADRYYLKSTAPDEVQRFCAFEGYELDSVKSSGTPVGDLIRSRIADGDVAQVAYTDPDFTVDGLEEGLYQDNPAQVAEGFDELRAYLENVHDPVSETERAAYDVYGDDLLGEDDEERQRIDAGKPLYLWRISKTQNGKDNPVLGNWVGRLEAYVGTRPVTLINTSYTSSNVDGAYRTGDLKHHKLGRKAGKIGWTSGGVKQSIRNVYRAHVDPLKDRLKR